MSQDIILQALLIVSVLLVLAGIGYALWSVSNRPKKHPAARRSQFRTKVGKIFGRKPKGWPLAKRLAKAILFSGKVPDEVRPFVVSSPQCKNCEGDRRLPRWSIEDAYVYLQQDQLAKALIAQALCTACLNELAKLAVKPPKKAVVNQTPEPEAKSDAKKRSGAPLARVLFSAGLAGMLAVYGLNELSFGAASARTNSEELVSILIFAGSIMVFLVVVVLLKSVLLRKK